MLTIDFGLEERRLTSHLLVAEPGIRLEKEHVEHVLDQRANGAITKRQLSDWASMLLMNDAYDLDGLNTNEIDELNELALLTSPERS